MTAADALHAHCCAQNVGVDIFVILSTRDEN